MQSKCLVVTATSVLGTKVNKIASEVRVINGRALRARGADDVIDGAANIKPQ